MIEVICFGKIKENYLKEMISDYEKRISKYLKFKIIELPDNQNILVEEQELLKSIDDKSYKILLDIEGVELDSVNLSKKIFDTFISYPKITFIIGGSNGVSQNIKNIVNYKLSFSRFTMPHGLFRGVLLEQIYRSIKINNNETYHK